jgi:hypothetical protein
MLENSKVNIYVAMCKLIYTAVSCVFGSCQRYKSQFFVLDGTISWHSPGTRPTPGGNWATAAAVLEVSIDKFYAVAIPFSVLRCCLSLASGAHS